MTALLFKVNTDDGKKAESTGSLLKKLFSTSAFESYRRGSAEAMRLPAFHEYISALCAERGEARERVIKRAGLDRVYGHQIFAGRYVPSRDKVIQLAFGFGMEENETQYLLRLARKPELYPRIERDAAILFCLHRRMGLMEAQTVLSDNGLTILGGDRSDK